MIIPKPINLSEADIARFWLKVNKCGQDECWEWQAGCYREGYGCFYDSLGNQYRANRVAYVITNGDTELEVLHSCNHPRCCNPVHLYVGSQHENIKQCYADGRGTDCCGEKSGKVKLAEADIQAIRSLRNNGLLLREIAEEYGISAFHVSCICRGTRWKHLA